jgi:hypothetical protein
MISDIRIREAGERLLKIATAKDPGLARDLAALIREVEFLRTIASRILKADESEYPEHIVMDLQAIAEGVRRHWGLSDQLLDV